MLTMDAIRTAFPAPISDYDRSLHDAACYCIGGAICLSARQVVSGLAVKDWQFPESADLAGVLVALNPALDVRAEDASDDIEETEAWAYAEAIIGHNDDREFDEAWRLADAALAYRQEAGKKDGRE